MRFEQRTRGNHAMAFAALAKDPTPWLQPSMFNPAIEKWNGKLGNERGGAVGSQNFRDSAEAAAFAGKVIKHRPISHGPALLEYSEVKFFLDLARVWRAYGFGGREFGSELYWPCMITAWTLLWRALDVGKALTIPLDPRALEIRHTLRRMWTLLAFCAMPNPISRYELYGSISDMKIKPESGRYNGVTVVLAGDRQNHAVVGQKLVGPMLSHALAIPGVHFKGYVPLRNIPLAEGPPVKGKVVVDGEEMDKNDYTLPWHFMLSIFCDLTGGGVYGNAVPWCIGLLPYEQDTLRDLVMGDEDAARKALPWLDGLTVWKGYEVVRVQRMDHGTMVACQGLSNRNKFGAPAASLTRNGHYRLMIPSDFKKTGATIPEIKWSERHVTASADDRTTTMPWLFGKNRLSLTIYPNGLATTEEE